ncbi:DNAH2 [Symbiodinium sp. CCMP2592]|nr:DNAH2 [Symbiodinium sp. CCMP2592]
MEAQSREKLTDVYGATILKALNQPQHAQPQHQLGSLSRVFSSAVLEVYDFAKSSFKRSPAAPYLTFTYRDVARTFQGILKALEGFGGSAPTEALLLESFLHEVARVFEDKLKLQLQKDLLHQELRRLRSFRGMTVTPNESEESEAPRRFLKRLSASIEKPYERVEEEQLWRCFQESLEEYRQLQAGDAQAAQAASAFFLSAEVVDQLCRLLRIGALARSHMLLLGLRGSGRRSLCGLAAHLLDAVKLELSKAVTQGDFLQMLRVVWRTCGAKQSDCILVLADEDLREDGVLDSISAVLDLGHVPELCSPDEIANMPARRVFITSAAKNADWLGTLGHMCDYAAMNKSPDSKSLINVECGSEGEPRGSLEGGLLAKHGGATQGLGETLDAAPAAGSGAAGSPPAEAASRLARSFSQVLRNFTQLWRLKSAQLAKRRGRLERALQAVARAPGVFEELQRKVQGLQAEVEEQEAKLRELRDVAACIAADVQRAQEQVREAEVFAEAKESACKTLQAEVQGAMDEVVQPYRTAVKAFEKAEKKEVSELKSFAPAPPPLILAIMEMVAMLFGCSTEWSAAKNLISESNFGKRFRDFDKDDSGPFEFWGNNDHLSDALSTRLKAEVSRADFNPTLVESQSKAAKFICNWLRALAAYDEVYRSTAGLRDRAGQTESEAEAARQELASKQAELKSLEEKADAKRECGSVRAAAWLWRRLRLNGGEAMEPAKMLEEAQSQMYGSWPPTSCHDGFSGSCLVPREILMNELDAGAKRTGLVSQVLHGGLFAEQGSWEKQLAALTRSSESLPGECMFAAVCLAYLGPVAPARRPLWEESLKSLWAEYDFTFSDPVHHQWELESVRSWDEDVDADPTSGSNVDSASERGATEDGLWTLPSFLFDEVSEQEWNAQGLPAALAVSAALALKVPLMPLCLDPHEQACRWLRKVIPSLTVTHAASPKLGQALTACRQEGNNRHGGKTLERFEVNKSY